MDYLNEILAGLSVGLDTLFPEVPVYAEKVPQVLPSRCFLTGFAGEVETFKERCGRYRITGDLDITYLAPLDMAETELHKEMNCVASRLALELNEISFRGLALRLRRHHCRVDGNELHDICGFYMAVRRQEAQTMMVDLKIKK